MLLQTQGVSLLFRLRRFHAELLVEFIGSADRCNGCVSGINLTGVDCIMNLHTVLRGLMGLAQEGAVRAITGSGRGDGDVSLQRNGLALAGCSWDPREGSILFHG